MLRIVIFSMQMTFLDVQVHRRWRRDETFYTLLDYCIRNVPHRLRFHACAYTHANCDGDACVTDRNGDKHADKNRDTFAADIDTHTRNANKHADFDRNRYPNFVDRNVDKYGDIQQYAQPYTNLTPL